MVQPFKLWSPSKFQKWVKIWSWIFLMELIFKFAWVFFFLPQNQIQVVLEKLINMVLLNRERNPKSQRRVNSWPGTRTWPAFGTWSACRSRTSRKCSLTWKSWKPRAGRCPSRWRATRSQEHRPRWNRNRPRPLKRTRPRSDSRTPRTWLPRSRPTTMPSAPTAIRTFNILRNKNKANSDWKYCYNTKKNLINLW